MSLLKWLYERYRESRFFKWAARSGFAAALLSLAFHFASTRLVAWMDNDPIYSGSFSTKLGESRCEPLSEGSQICLNTDSEARYRFNGATRNAEILRGEASFVVQKDRRPFDVLAGRVLVHDISTGFDIYKLRDSIRVTVTDGRVRTIAPVDTDSRSQFTQGKPESAWKAAPELRKFQQAEFDEITGKWYPLPGLTERHLSRLLAWEEGRIDLNDRTVSDSLQELARYQTLPTFKCNSSIGNMRLDGDLAFKDLDGFLLTMEYVFHIHHTTSGSGASRVITLTRQLGKTGENSPRC